MGPVARAAAWVFLRGTPYYDLPMFPMVGDSIAMGCLLARLRGYLEEQRWYLKLFHPAVSILLAAIALVINRNLSYTMVSVPGWSIINLILTILIHRSVYCCRDVSGRFLNWKPFATIGVLSYSLYIWQQLFINRNSSAWINAFPQNLLFAVTAATASYLLLEKPLLKLRQRLRA